MYLSLYTDYIMQTARWAIGIYVPSYMFKCYVACDMYLLTYRLHHANSQMGYQNKCAEYMFKCYVACEMYLLTYRLHHANSQMGYRKMCRVYGQMSCNMQYVPFTYRLHHANSQMGY
jgi:hypothetical protein